MPQIAKIMKMSQTHDKYNIFFKPHYQIIWREIVTNSEEATHENMNTTRQLWYGKREVSSDFRFQSSDFTRLFCLCRLPAVNKGNLRITINHATNCQNHENVSNPYIYYTYRVMVFNATFNNISVSLHQSLCCGECFHD
jgi:hypothetical protein